MLVDRWVSIERVRNPCAIVTLYGESCADFTGSTWMNWWARVQSATWLIRSCVTWNHSPGCSGLPMTLLKISIAFSALLAMLDLASGGFGHSLVVGRAVFNAGSAR